MLDLQPTLDLLTAATAYYEKRAPTVESYLDDLYIRIHDAPETVRLVELLRVQRLRENGEWMHPNYAANVVYKLMEALGQDTTGHAGF